MAAWASLVAVLPFVLLLCASAVWADRRYAAFEEIPRHFDIRGEADALEKRRTMVWALPAAFSLFLLFFGGVVPLVSEPGTSFVGPTIGIGLVVCAAQVLVLALTDRWAKRHGS